MAHPSVWLSQRACCLKKLFTCQGTPCRRGQTVTGSGAGRTFRFGSPSIYNGHFFSKTWYCQRKISENLSTLLSESASGFVPCFALSTFQRTEICRLLSMPVRKILLCWLRELVAVRAVFKTLRGDGACKALSLGEVAAAVRLRIAGFGEGTPQQDSDAKSGTSVESCSLLLQASLHFTTDIFPAKSRVRICKHFVNELPSPAVRCCDFFSVFMASQQRDYDIPMVTLALPLVRLDRSVFPPLPLLQSQKRFLAKSQIVF